MTRVEKCHLGRVIKRVCHDVFIVERDKHSASWTKERVEKALCADRYFSRDLSALAEARNEVIEKLADNCGLAIIGKRELLTKHKLLPLICHRAESHAFEKQKEAVMKAAREGAVIISAPPTGTA